MAKKAIIIGAGPAGLTVAYELLTRTDVKPVILEKSYELGGLSRTIDYKGNKIDIGGHRFFSKSNRVMQWWLDKMPIQDETLNPDHHDTVMLKRIRSSRILYMRKLFDYPLQLNPETIKKLGVKKVCKIGTSYIKSSLMPIKNEQTLEDFFINRFGFELYSTFFKSYTEKVWGVPCNEISTAWGTQRVKGLSIKKAIADFFQKKFCSQQDIAQKNVETSLIDKFLYPKFGPGHMWQEVARRIQELGGEIHFGCDVQKILVHEHRITGIQIINNQSTQNIEGDHLFSTMPIKDLVAGLQTEVPGAVAAIARELPYRDFLTVGLLLNKLCVHDKRALQDNWIYIQEPDVLVGRLQIFNNWSPYMVADQSKIWVGLEYFCYEHDEFWQQSDEAIKNLAVKELIKFGMITSGDVLDEVVIRASKAYPAYFCSYAQFDVLKEYFSTFENLFLLGRNGMHRYNNQDHSMLTAMTAVDNIINGITSKENIWAVNTEKEYHEEKR